MAYINLNESISCQGIRTCHIQIGLIMNLNLTSPDLACRPNQDFQVLIGCDWKLFSSGSIINFFYFFIATLENYSPVNSKKIKPRISSHGYSIIDILLREKKN